MIILNVQSDPADRYFYANIEGHSRKENVLTIGTGSYAGKSSLSDFPENLNSPHLLIGRFCSLAAENKFIVGGNHNYKNVSAFPFDAKIIAKNILGFDKSLPSNRPNHYQVIIGHDVWIGHGAMIMGGVKIGNGAVIGAGAVVAKDIPPYAIVVGNPARIIKYRFDEETIKKFLAVKWWNWDLKKIEENLPLMNDVEKFLEAHYSPELENFPEDDLAEQIENFRNLGFRVYNFITDFRAKYPLWLRVIAGFCQSAFERAIIIIWIDKDANEQDFSLLSKAIDIVGRDAGKNIFVIDMGDAATFSPAAIKKSTHFITNREMTSLEAFDYLWNTDVKIISALDDKIFEGEPPVDWENLYG